MIYDPFMCIYVKIFAYGKRRVIIERSLGLILTECGGDIISVNQRRVRQNSTIKQLGIRPIHLTHAYQGRI